MPDTHTTLTCRANFIARDPSNRQSHCEQNSVLASVTLEQVALKFALKDANRFLFYLTPNITDDSREDQIVIANPIPWPNGARCAVAITWDVDADSGLNYNNPETADNLVTTQSFLRYGPHIAVPRLMEVFRRLDMRQTFFVPGWVIERYPETVDLILENHHEVALHGYIHERSNELSADEENHVLVFRSKQMIPIGQV